MLSSSNQLLNIKCLTSSLNGQSIPLSHFSFSSPSSHPQSEVAAIAQEMANNGANNANGTANDTSRRMSGSFAGGGAGGGSFSAASPGGKPSFAGPLPSTDFFVSGAGGGTQSTNLSLPDCRGIIKTLVCGMKTLTWGAGSCRLPGSTIDFGM